MSLIELFYEILTERPNHSEISGKPLQKYLTNSNFFFSCFAHIIPKSGPSTIAVPKEIKKNFLRENKDNIMLVTPEEHHLLDHGTQDAREKYEKENGCSFDIFYKKKDDLMEALGTLISNY